MKIVYKRKDENYFYEILLLNEILVKYVKKISPEIYYMKIGNMKKPIYGIYSLSHPSLGQPYMPAFTWNFVSKPLHLDTAGDDLVHLITLDALLSIYIVYMS